MPDRHDEHEQYLVFDLIDDPVIASSNPVKIFAAFYLLNPMRPRISRELFDFPRDLLPILLRKPSEFALD